VEKKGKMNMIRRMTGGLSLLVLTAALGNASTIAYYTDIFVPGPNGSYGTSIGSALTNAQLIAQGSGATKYDTTAAGLTSAVTLPKFDTSIASPGMYAVLDSVQIAVGWAALGAIDVTNSNGATEAFSAATSTVPLHFFGPAGLTFNVNATAGPVSGTVGAETVTPNFNHADLNSIVGSIGATAAANLCQNTLLGTWHSGTGICDVPNGSTTTPGTTEVSGVNQADTAYSSVITSGLYNFIGSGGTNLSFTVNLDQGVYGGSSVPGVSFGGSASAGAAMEIIYTYHETPLPEPVTMSLVGSALVGIAVIARRKVTKQQ
jgi:hypothetical protein